MCICENLHQIDDYPFKYFAFVSLLSRSVLSDSETPWTVAHQAPLSMGFPRQEHCSGFLFYSYFLISCDPPDRASLVTWAVQSPPKALCSRDADYPRAQALSGGPDAHPLR